MSDELQNKIAEALAALQAGAPEAWEALRGQVVARGVIAAALCAMLVAVAALSIWWVWARLYPRIDEKDGGPYGTAGMDASMATIGILLVAAAPAIYGISSAMAAVAPDLVLLELVTP